MTINRGPGGTGDSTRGEDIYGPNTTITELSGLQGPIKKPTYIEFDQTSVITPLAGQVTWNATEGTLDVGLNGGTVVLQTGEETLYRVINQSGSNIANGDLVCYAGTNGNSGKLKVKAWTGAEASNTLMGLATDDIANGAVGFVTHFGKVRGIQTNGANYGETWVDGDILYAGPSGGLTKIKPSAPDTKSTIALVVRAHGSNGTFFVRPSLSSNLGDDDLVEITSLTNGDILAYNSTSGRFENIDPSVLSGTIPDGDKGDITVSGSGATWTIDVGVVSTTELGGDITTAGKALLDDASAADQRTTLGLGTAATTASTDYATAAQGALAASALQPGAIGTTVQAYDADLTTWAGKTAPTGDVVGTSDSQTLSNKTLTAPVISTISNTGTLTLPTSTDTLVGKATTDTLTNKTLTSPVLTTPTINSAQIPTISGTAPLYLCRAWVNFNGAGTVSIRGSGNVTSITDNGTGDYTVNFTTALPDANYCPNITRDSQSGVTGGILGIASTSGSPTLMSTTQLRFYTSNAATASLQDANILAVAVFR